MEKTLIAMKLFHLHHCLIGSPGMLDKIFKGDPQLEFIFQMSPLELIHHFQLTERQASSLYKTMHEFDAKSTYDHYQRNHIRVITIVDQEYPELLRNIYHPPMVLYCKGDLTLLQGKRLLAMVGTREPTMYGKVVTKKLVRDLVNEKITIVSGLARGVDTIVHQETMISGGKTIAVLGSGFHHPYPKENIALFRSLEKEHLLISEYPPHIPPKPYHFPERNRIISGISLGTVIIEAKEKSGSLITANFALEQGREVFAVPGPITSKHSVGTNLLIQEGAKLVQKAEDILEELPLS